MLPSDSAVHHATIARDQLLALYHTMKLARTLEERARALAKAHKLPSLPPTARGSEAIAAGATAALYQRDPIAPGHSNLAAYLQRGYHPREIIRAWLLPSTFTGRYPGDMQLHAVIPGMGEPTTTAAMAAGIALGLQLRQQQQVVLAFCHERDTLQGLFHETLALAATLSLPLVCLITTDSRGNDTADRVQHAADRGAFYGLARVIVDGTDIFAVHACVSEAVQQARMGRGPSILQARTFAWQDSERGGEDWRRRDPIERVIRYMAHHGIVSAEGLIAIDQVVQDQVDDAILAEMGPDAAHIGRTAVELAPVFVPVPSPPTLKRDRLTEESDSHDR